MSIAGYIVTVTLSVGLVLLLRQGWSDLARAELRVSTCWLIVVLSRVLVATTGRIIPGGPFVSVHGDILPVLGCVALLALGAMGSRAVSPKRRMGFRLAMLASLGLIGLVVASLASFWRDPFARGPFLQW